MLCLAFYTFVCPYVKLAVTVCVYVSSYCYKNVALKLALLFAGLVKRKCHSGYAIYTTNTCPLSGGCFEKVESNVCACMSVYMHVFINIFECAYV